MLLELLDVIVRYGNIDVLKSIHLRVSEGQIVSIIGSNGAGKTTILKGISGSKRIAAGEILFNKKNIERFATQNIVKEGIAHVPEGWQVFPNMTVLENLEMGAYLRRDKSTIETDMQRVFSHFPILQSRKKQNAGTLSGGEQQMMAVGRALMAAPQLMLLDEPSLGMAPLIVEELDRIISEINKEGVSILLVEQNTVLALDLADYCYVLETGQIVLEGSSESLIDNDMVRKAYLGL